MLNIYNIKEMAKDGEIEWIPIAENFKKIYRIVPTSVDVGDFLDIEVDNDVSDNELNNLRSLVFDSKNNIISRFMPYLKDYSELTNVERSDFLSDKVTMIEYIYGKEVAFNLYQGNVLAFDKNNGNDVNLFYSFFESLDIKLDMKKIISIFNKRMKCNSTIIFNISENNKIYLTSVIKNKIEIERMKEREVNFILNNIQGNFVSLINRPIYFTTSLNESNHKANIEWVMESQGNYCLMLNHIKRKDYAKNNTS